MSKRRLLLAVVLALMLSGVLANVALAFDCNNPNINDNAVVGVFDIATETFTPNKANWGSFDKVHGAWVKLLFPWGDSYNVFVHRLLPDGALNAGPGDNLCDGIGIDDLDACLMVMPPG